MKRTWITVLLNQRKLMILFKSQAVDLIQTKKCSPERMVERQIVFKRSVGSLWTLLQSVIEQFWTSNKEINMSCIFSMIERWVHLDTFTVRHKEINMSCTFSKIDFTLKTESAVWTKLYLWYKVDLIIFSRPKIGIIRYK